MAVDVTRFHTEKDIVLVLVTEENLNDDSLMVWMNEHYFYAKNYAKKDAQDQLRHSGGTWTGLIFVEASHEKLPETKLSYVSIGNYLSVSRYGEAKAIKYEDAQDIIRIDNLKHELAILQSEVARGE